VILGAADVATHAWFSNSGKTDAPSWLNRADLESVARLAEYNPGGLHRPHCPKRPGSG
jgi:hypothetical protein